MLKALNQDRGGRDGEQGLGLKRFLIRGYPAWRLVDTEEEEEGGVGMVFQVPGLGGCVWRSQPIKQGNMGGGAGWGAEDRLVRDLLIPSIRKMFR